MPFRIVGYDGAAYRSQLQQERKRMLPVVTIVLYFGTDRHWNSRKKIKELMEIPRCLDTYVNDYQMHVFEVAWLTEEQISHFRSDFKVVANFFVQKRKNKDYIPDDPTEIRHVDEVLKLLQVMTGDRRYEEIFRKKKEEFPQFFNVLKGDMSIVGTRPPLISETNLYELHHRVRLAIKPGITGMWQVSGRSDITDFEEVVRLDKEYISNWNIGLDIKILLKTVLVVFKRDGSM